MIVFLVTCTVCQFGIQGLLSGVEVLLPTSPGALAQLLGAACLLATQRRGWSTSGSRLMLAPMANAKLAREVVKRACGQMLYLHPGPQPLRSS